MIKDIENMSDEQIKQWLQDNGVYFATNSTMFPDSLYVHSLKRYIDYIPETNMLTIPGFDIATGKIIYGMKAFYRMLICAISMTKDCKYIVYIDDDCFITDFRALIGELSRFIESECCLAGPQDGGVICHRNHSSMLINTFLSFWNIATIREKFSEFEKLLQKYVDHPEPFKLFKEELLKKNMNLQALANEHISKEVAYRESHEPFGKFAYCDIVKNDETNKVEPHQMPYSCDDLIATKNFEPYYALLESIVLFTERPIHYFNARDLYAEEFASSEVNGLASAVFNEDNTKMIAVHSWFSRAYTKNCKSDVERFHTDRINSLLDWLRTNA